MFSVRVSDLRVMFSLFDQNGDGYITSRELREVMKSLGYDVKSDQAVKAIRVVDLDSE